MDHRSAAARWCPLTGSTIADTVNEGDLGHPEHQPTLLPSSLPPSTIQSVVSGSILETERELRRVKCLKALQTLRSVAMQHAHLSNSKAKHARGIRAVTRAQDLIQRLTSKMEALRWEYTHSRARLKVLGMTKRDQKTFLSLRASDLQELRFAASKNPRLGEGRIMLPWYWRVNLADEDGTSTLTREATDVSKEYEESE